MTRPHVSRPQLMNSLKVLQSGLLLVMVIMFINFNAKIAQQAAATNEITSSTNKVVKSQADILTAIKQVTDDTHTTAAQQTAIIICMLQVPVSQRTTDLQNQCRATANAAVASSAAGTHQSSTGTSSSVSSPNTTPSTPAPQSDNPQPEVKSVPKNCTIDILFIHVGKCS